MAGVKMYGRRHVNRVVSHQPGVRKAVQQGARQIHRKATTKLSHHRKTGNAKVTLTHGRVDSFVNLDDPGGNALSIEFGHDHNVTGEHVGGLYIITRSAGLIE